MYDYEATVAAVKVIVEKHGEDFTYVRPDVDENGNQYGACNYVHVKDGKCTPGCIIGHLLYNFELIKLEELNDTTHNSIGVGGLLRELNLEDKFTDKAKSFMSSLQMEQDQRDTTWGYALAVAQSRVGGMAENDPEIIDGNENHLCTCGCMDD